MGPCKTGVLREVVSEESYDSNFFHSLRERLPQILKLAPNFWRGQG